VIALNINIACFYISKKAYFARRALRYCSSSSINIDVAEPLTGGALALSSSRNDAGQQSLL
jgi:predicted aldo/keto reductase-like oxidoreductase